MPIDHEKASCERPITCPSDPGDYGQEGKPGASREASEITGNHYGVPRAEVDGLAAYWEAWPDLRERLFIDDNAPYLRLKVSSNQIDEAIDRHGGAWSWLHAHIDAIFPSHGFSG